MQDLGKNAQWVNCLLSKQEDLSLDFQQTLKFQTYQCAEERVKKDELQ